MIGLADYATDHSRKSMRWIPKRFPFLARWVGPLGDRGEKIALDFLKQAGFRIIQTNYVCPIGEIDIIAADGDVLVFVEVKTRRSDVENDPEESVNWHKRRKLTQVARHFIAHKNAHNMTARFDVVAIVMPESGKPVITHFVEAFAPTPR